MNREKSSLKVITLFYFLIILIVPLNLNKLHWSTCFIIFFLNSKFKMCISPMDNHVRLICAIPQLVYIVQTAQEHTPPVQLQTRLELVAA